jgi:hypothetical protein
MMMAESQSPPPPPLAWHRRQEAHMEVEMDREATNAAFCGASRGDWSSKLVSDCRLFLKLALLTIVRAAN